MTLKPVKEDLHGFKHAMMIPFVLESICLLSFIRMLPGPLMTYQYQRNFIKAASESLSICWLIYTDLFRFSDSIWLQSAQASKTPSKAGNPGCKIMKMDCLRPRGMWSLHKIYINFHFHTTKN